MPGTWGGAECDGPEFPGTGAGAEAEAGALAGAGAGKQKKVHWQINLLDVNVAVMHIRAGYSMSTCSLVQNTHQWLMRGLRDLKCPLSKKPLWLHRVQRRWRRHRWYSLPQSLR